MYPSGGKKKPPTKKTQAIRRPDFSTLGLEWVKLLSEIISLLIFQQIPFPVAKTLGISRKICLFTENKNPAHAVVLIFREKTGHGTC